MQNHLLRFLPKGVDYKNSCFPPFVCSFMSFLFNFCSKNMERQKYIQVFKFLYMKNNSFFFSSECDIWLVKITAHYRQLTPSVVMVGLVSKFSHQMNGLHDCLTLGCTLPSLDRFLLQTHRIFDNGSHTSMSLVPLFRHYLK